MIAIKTKWWFILLFVSAEVLNKHGWKYHDEKRLKYNLNQISKMKPKYLRDSKFYVIYTILFF